MRRLPASRRIAPGPNASLDRRELPERNARAVVAVDEQRANRVDVAATCSSGRRTTRSKRRWPIQISRPPRRPVRCGPRGSRRRARGPTRAVAARSTAMRSCGRPLSCSARRSETPRTPLMMSRARCASRASSSRSGPKMRTEMSAGVPPSPSSMRMPSGVVKSTVDARHVLQSRRACASSSSSRRRLRSSFSTTSTSEIVCGIGSSVRSARPVRRTTSSTSGNSRNRSSTR